MDYEDAVAIIMAVCEHAWREARGEWTNSWVERSRKRKQKNVMDAQEFIVWMSRGGSRMYNEFVNVWVPVDEMDISPGELYLARCRSLTADDNRALYHLVDVVEGLDGPELRADEPGNYDMEILYFNPREEWIDKSVQEQVVSLMKLNEYFDVFDE